MHPKLTDTLSKYQHVVLVGGGTGGHIQPILNIASELHDTKLLWIGGADSYEQQAAKDAHIDFESIPILKLTSTKSPKILLYPIVLLRGILEARRTLASVMSTIGDILPQKREQDFSLHSKGQSTESLHASRGQDATTTTPAKEPICVFSKGGPGSVAVGIAAWSLGIPLYIHESDTIPGRSNRILGRFATRVFLGFESAKSYFDAKKCEVIGQILGASFAKEVLAGRRTSAGNKKQISPTPLYKEGPKWHTNKPHLLVICGSQGARVIFTEILQHITTIVEKYEVILVLGKLNTDMRADFEKALADREHTNLTLLDWIEQESLASLIRDTDIAITRGSATTLAELTILESGKPHLIIIPLPYAADNHQHYNALEYQKIGHTLLEQKNISTLIDLL